MSGAGDRQGGAEVGWREVGVLGPTDAAADDKVTSDPTVIQYRPLTYTYVRGRNM